MCPIQIRVVKKLWQLKGIEENQDYLQDQQNNQENYEDGDPFKDPDNPKEDEENFSLKIQEISNNLKVHIDEQGLDENQKLRKWKDHLTEQAQN